ncbi:MAG TPA: DUF3426 domain-containing protein [Alphaproteobacteria bacterium]|nr:DUF3426 domain-containing protein [Alphaproteobacteria bacterium]
MIVTCPSCSTRYAVDPASLGVDGRKVKCARCAHQWFQAPPPAEDADGRPPVSPPPADVLPRPIPPGSNLPAPPRRQNRRSGAAAGWALLLLLVAGLLAAGYVGRAQIVRLWPPAMKLYQELGVDVAALDLAGATGIGPGLAFAGITSERAEGAGGQVLWVRGEIANDSAFARTIPPLEVTLLDGDEAPVENWTFAVEPAELAPGESVPFETSRRNIADSAARLLISVAP